MRWCIWVHCEEQVWDMRHPSVQGQSATLDFKVTNTENGAETIHTCIVSHYIAKQQLWSDMGKTAQCPLNLTTWNGYFVRPCDLVRPAPPVNVTLGASQFTWDNGQAVQHKDVTLANQGPEATVVTVMARPAEACTFANATSDHVETLQPGKTVAVPLYVVNNTAEGCYITVNATRKPMCNESQVIYTHAWNIGAETASGEQTTSTGAIIGAAVGSVALLLAVSGAVVVCATTEAPLDHRASIGPCHTMPGHAMPGQARPGHLGSPIAMPCICSSCIRPSHGLL
jgi:hypothetical protein